MLDSIKVLFVIGVLVGSLVYGIHTTVSAFNDCKTGGTVVRGAFKMVCIK